MDVRVHPSFTIDSLSTNHRRSLVENVQLENVDQQQQQQAEAKEEDHGNEHHQQLNCCSFLAVTLHSLGIIFGDMWVEFK